MQGPSIVSNRGHWSRGIIIDLRFRGCSFLIALELECTGSVQYTHAALRWKFVRGPRALELGSARDSVSDGPGPRSEPTESSVC